MATAVYGAAYHRAEEATADARHERHYARQVAHLERLLDGSGRRLLDVGCGAGAFLRFGRDRGWDVDGTDLVVTDWARASGARLWEGELPAIEFGDARYDVVRFNHVLEHTRDPLLELRRARRLVTPGGLLLVGVPNVAGLNPRLKSWQSRVGLKRKRWRHYAALHHLWFFTPATLRRLAEAAAFEVVRWETPRHGPAGKVGRPDTCVSRRARDRARRQPAGPLRSRSLTCVGAGRPAVPCLVCNNRPTMPDERPMFLHPPWMVGIMLILGVLSLVVGLTLDPFWLVMGSPAILTLAVYVGVRIVLWRRAGRRHTLDTGTREPGPWNRPPPAAAARTDDPGRRRRRGRGRG